MVVDVDVVVVEVEVEVVVVEVEVVVVVEVEVEVELVEVKSLPFCAYPWPFFTLPTSSKEAFCKSQRSFFSIKNLLVFLWIPPNSSMGNALSAGIIYLGNRSRPQLERPCLNRFCHKAYS